METPAAPASEPAAPASGFVGVDAPIGAILSGDPAIERTEGPASPAPAPIDSNVREVPVASMRLGRDHALVLQAVGIPTSLRMTEAGPALIVAKDDLGRALDNLRRYDEENRDWPPRPAPERSRHAASIIPTLMFVALALFMLTTGPVASQSRWFTRGASVSTLVLSSEPWRAVTALTLHADAGHVLGNMLSGAIFASAISRRIGPGATALTVLASGIAGNYANAVFHHMMGYGVHRSIGASTAVFGAVAILAVTQIAAHRATPNRQRSWMDLGTPIAGALALLAMLGASPESDLGAHLFGFLFGLVIGVVAVVAFMRGRSPKARGTRANALVQALSGAAALAIVVGSWRLAMG